jgi:hypothetical protein
VSATTLNAIGLSLNVVGALAIFFFGVPRYPTSDRAGVGFIALEKDDPVERRKVARADWLSKGGVLFLLVGFAVQLAALYVS